MGHDIKILNSDGKVCIVDEHEDCGNYSIMGGTNNAQIGITYNYSKFYYTTIDTKLGLKWIYGKSGKECIARLKKAIKMLGTYKDQDYWNSTPGNAGYALSILLNWAEQHPDGIFEGD